jgi:hypothetical protein
VEHSPPRVAPASDESPSVAPGMVEAGAEPAEDPAAESGPDPAAVAGAGCGRKSPSCLAPVGVLSCINNPCVHLFLLQIALDFHP